MAAVIITTKDVERLGKETMKEVNKFLHNDYIITTFKEMKNEQEKFIKYLTCYYINNLIKNYKLLEEKREKKRRIN